MTETTDIDQELAATLDALANKKDIADRELQVCNLRQMFVEAAQIIRKIDKGDITIKTADIGYLERGEEELEDRDYWVEGFKEAPFMEEAALALMRRAAVVSMEEANKQLFYYGETFEEGFINQICSDEAND